MGVVALTPLTLAWHRRSGVGALATLVLAVMVVEVLRFGFGIGWIGWLNLAMVWIAVHQIGYFYADGSLVDAGPRLWWIMVFAGLAVLIGLTNLEVFTGELWYPRSMVGVDIEAISNMSPPSFAILALTCFQIGAAMHGREAVNRWLGRPRAWASVVYVNTIIMTMFLWHLTALLVVIVLLYPAGFGQSVDATARWWGERLLWITAPALVLIGLVWIFGRFERPSLPAAN